MNEKITVACSAIGIVGSVIAQSLGGWDSAVLTLIIFMSIDFATGLACAVFWNKSKHDSKAERISKFRWF